MANHPKRTFHIASESDIKAGEVSDVYFARTVQILRAKGINKRVKAEIRLKSFPQADWSFGILAGIEEAATLLEGLPVDVWTMDEGTMFAPYEPVVLVEGNYLDWAEFETALLGFLCQASGIATKAARCKRAAGERQVISFGARRMHPALAPMIERNAFIGGCDGVAVTKAAELIDADPMGTIPHALVLMFGDTVGKDLYAVRLDTPSSRRGDFFRILEEVRWELDFRGFEHVKILASGGIDEYEILKLNPLVDGYGVGTSIANAPVLSFALDIMEIEGKPMAKRGKQSGAKQVWRLPGTVQNRVLPAHKPAPMAPDGRPAEALLKPLIAGGRLVRDLPPPRTIREYVIEQMARIDIGASRERGLRGDY
jgi:nicotinate phosphoribosyltransferase